MKAAEQAPKEEVEPQGPATPDESAIASTKHGKLVPDGGTAHAGDALHFGEVNSAPEQAHLALASPPEPPQAQALGQRGAVTGHAQLGKSTVAGADRPNRQAIDRKGTEDLTMRTDPSVKHLGRHAEPSVIMPRESLVPAAPVDKADARPAAHLPGAALSEIHYKKGVALEGTRHSAAGERVLDPGSLLQEDVSEQPRWPSVQVSPKQDAATLQMPGSAAAYPQSRALHQNSTGALITTVNTAPSPLESLTSPVEGLPKEAARSHSAARAMPGTFLQAPDGLPVSAGAATSQPQAAQPLLIEPSFMQPEEVSRDLRDLSELRGLTDPSSPNRAAMAEMPERLGLARQVSHQLLAQIQYRGAGQPVELQLSPVELGRVTLQMQPVDNVMVVHIVVERPETLELLRRHAELLAQDFREAGFDSTKFTFSEQDRQAEKQAENGNHTNAPAAGLSLRGDGLASAAAGDAQSSSGAAPRGDHARLDIRI